MMQHEAEHRNRHEPWQWTALVFGFVLLVGLAVFVSRCSQPKPAPPPTATATAAPSGLVAIPAPTPTPLACHARGPLPDPVCTPGATDARVTQENIHQTICVVGYTKTVRPPVDVTARIKQERMAIYDVPGTAAGYELDHLASLELGGDPLAVANLWPEAADPRPGFHEKDRYENYLHRQVCSGAMTLAAAQKQIATDWLSGWKAAGQP